MERRNQVRYKANIPATIKNDGNNSGFTLKTSTRNISSDGACLNIAVSNIHPKQRVQLDFTFTIESEDCFPKKYQIVFMKLHGSIIRMHEDCIAVQFEDMNVIEAQN